MKPKKRILKFLVVRSEFWYRLIIFCLVADFSARFGKIAFVSSIIIGSLWIINGWRLSLIAYGGKYKEVKQ